VIIDIEEILEERLPVTGSISTVTRAELAVGPHATSNLEEKAARQARLQAAEAQFEAIPFDQ
jgi:tRNA(fMet)-specific endonuclease VapC